MRWPIVLSLLMVIAAPVRAAGVRSVPVILQNLVGEPADSLARREFMTGFRAAMDADTFACERLAGDAWRSSAAHANQFQLVDMVGSGEVWSLDLSIGVPPEVKVKRRRPVDPRQQAPRARVSEVRVSRGLTIAVAVTSPRAAAAGTPPTPEAFAVYFSGARRVVVPSAKLPSGGYDYPWSDAGRAVALAALEVLHRGTEQLARDERADLSPATRTEPAP